MDTMEIDPKYIAEQLRSLRKMFSLTQENLAEMAGLTNRTIEKLESGRHRPNEQTLRSLARALKMDIGVFRRPSAEEMRSQRAEMERAIRKIVVVPTTPVRDAADFFTRFGLPSAVRFDMSSVSGDGAAETAVLMGDYLMDMILAWSDLTHSLRLSSAREFFEMCEDIRRHGYFCHMGSYSQRLRTAGKPDLTFDVRLISILPMAQSDGERYGLVQLEGAWETLERDRVPLPDE